MTNVPVHDSNDIGLPIGERSSDTSPVDSSVRFVEAVLVEPSDADNSLVFVQIAGGLRSGWHEQEDADCE